MEFLRLQKLLQDYYAVPDYQREYEWTNVQNAVLLDDIIALMNDDSNENHFTGAIVSIPYEKDNGVNTSIDFSEYGINEGSVKHIVDGQQRLTSLSVLIASLRSLIEKDETLENEIKKNYCDVLSRLLLGDDTKALSTGYVNAPRIILSGNTGKCYYKAILGVGNDNYNGIYKGAKRLIKARDFFVSELITRRDEYINNHIVSSSEQFYKKIMEVIRMRIVFVEILCDESSNAFQVFDSLNGKGLDLTAADRIKNVLMSWSPRAKGATKWESLVTVVGEDNLTNFFVALFFYNERRRISKNKLPDAFKNTYKESATTDFDYFFNNLYKDGDLYGALRRNVTDNERVCEGLNDLQQLNSEQVYVLLYSALKQYGNIINEDGFADYIQSIIRLIVRIQVCEKSTNRLDNKFSEWIDMMKNQCMPLNTICRKIDEYRLSLCDDTQFESAFAKFSPYDNKLSEYYLRCLENEERREAGIRQNVMRGLTVEHIVPQGIDPTIWYGEIVIPEEIVDDFKELVVENIGNKALLYGDDNSSANNNVYEDKKDVYINGKRGQDKGKPKDTFCLISELLERYPYKFNHDEVADRAKHLAKIAVEIW